MIDRDRERRAASFGPDARNYAEHRPDYPLDAVRWGLAAARPAAGTVLDLGAGTGKLTVNLLELGHAVTAVEPDELMLAELRDRLPGTRALVGSAEHLPLPDAAVDAVAVGQALHWFDFDVALAEIARVLRPGGVLVALWNQHDTSVPWLAEFDRIQRGGIRDTGSRADRLPERHPPFGPFEHGEFAHAQRRTAEELVRTIATQSHLLVAPAAERERTLAAARAFLAGNAVTARGAFELPLRTTVVRAVRE